MSSLSSISNLDFKKVLTPENIRVFQIIYFSLAAGALAFGLVILMVYFQYQSKEYDEVTINLLNMLTVVNAIFVITSIVLGKFLYDRQFKVANNHSTAGQCLAIIRTASIIRIAQLEGSAFLGLVVTLLAVQNGAGNYQPLYFLNALSVLPLFVFIATTFPSADRLEKIFQDKFVKR